MMMFAAVLCCVVTMTVFTACGSDDKVRDYSYTIGFDNLAIEQLRIKEFLPEDEWENLYMGDEGQHSMYIDAVRGEFARTSRSEERTSWDDVGLIDFFNSLKNDSANK